MTDLDADVKRLLVSNLDLMVDDMRERQKERAEGRSLATVLDAVGDLRTETRDAIAELRGEMISIRADVDEKLDQMREDMKRGRIDTLDRARRYENRFEKIERRIGSSPSSIPPPNAGGRKRKLDSLIDIDGNEITETRDLKLAVAPVLATFKFWSDAKIYALGMLGVVGIIAAIYAAVFKK
jgi:hypothetical protein